MLIHLGLKPEWMSINYLIAVWRSVAFQEIDGPSLIVGDIRVGTHVHREIGSGGWSRKLTGSHGCHYLVDIVCSKFRGLVPT